MDMIITLGETPKTIVNRCFIFSSVVQLYKKIKIPLNSLKTIIKFITYRGSKY